MITDDLTLLREYARTNSGEAIAALVSRHVNLVYSVALRQVHDPHLAEDIAQATFIILARKAGSFDDRAILSGWLCRTARYVSADALKIQRRRQRREQEAYLQSQSNDPESEAWNEIAPLLESALGGLGRKDHDAIVLRFFEGKSMREVGAALGATEDSAKKRVQRALKKLQKFFFKRGVTSTTTVIAGLLAARSVHAAPVSLAKSITAVAVTKGVTAGGSTLTLIKTALKLMAWTNAKTAIVTGIGVLFVLGTTTVTVKKVSQLRAENVWDHIFPASDDAARNSQDWEQLQKAPAGVSIRPTKFSSQMANIQFGDGKILGLHQPFDAALSRAYDINPARILALTPLPAGDFDFIVSGPNPPRNALQLEIKSKYGFAGRRETREKDVLLLRVKRSDAPGLKPAADPLEPSSSFFSPGHLRRSNGPIKFLANDLELYLQIPVIDETGLNNRVDYDMNWNDALTWEDDGRCHYTNSDGLKQVLLSQLGLELMPARLPVDLLVVDKAAP